MDALDPAQNASLLATAIKGAKVHLYPDAGHTFLFQDYTDFVGPRSMLFWADRANRRSARGEAIIGTLDAVALT